MIWIDPRFWLAVVVAAVIGSAGGYFKGHRDGVRATTAVEQKATMAAVEAARASLSECLCVRHKLMAKEPLYATQTQG
ncbi:hypothetical protein GT630_28755, partial [Burkholderia thailandensis]|nr:hypothetical protein [Burkholderia thailandensis]